MTNEAIPRTSDAALRADANLRAAARAWALAAATGEAWEETGVVVSSSGVDIRSFNSAFVTSSDGCALLGKARAYFEARAVKFRVRVAQDVPIDSGAMSEAGLERRGGIPCLALSPLPPVQAAAGIEIRPVAGDETLRQHVEVVAACFDWQPDVLAKVFTEHLLADPAWRGFVGYIDARPVASSQLYMADGIAGIDYVATLDTHRRRGFGEAMTWHAVAEGRAAGYDVASLQASPMGLPIYERMGFRQVGYYRTYVPKEA